MQRRSFLLTGLAAGPFLTSHAAAQQAQITGAGATFPFPVYSK